MTLLVQIQNSFWSVSRLIFSIPGPEYCFHFSEFQTCFFFSFNRDVNVNMFVFFAPERVKCTDRLCVCLFLFVFEEGEGSLSWD